MRRASDKIGDDSRRGSIHVVDDIDNAEKYLIRHKCKRLMVNELIVGEHIREGEDIDITDLPDHIKK